MKFILPLLFVASLFFSACGGGQPQVSTDNMLMTGNPEIDALTKQIAERPNDPNLYAARGDAYYRNNEYEQAIINLEKAISLDSTRIDYYQVLSDAYLDNKKSAKALSTLRRCSRNFPDSVRAQLSTAELELILKQYDASTKTIRAILEKDHLNADAYYLLGMVFKENKDTIKALSSFQTAIEQNSDFINAYNQLGFINEARNNPIALKYFDNSLRIDSIDFDALNGKARYFHLRKQYKEAEKIYRKMAIHYPQEPEVQNNFGLLYSEQKDFKKAAQCFELCTKIDPKFAPPYYYLGWIAEHDGKKDEAIRYYRQCLAFDASFPAAKEALKMLGVEE